MAAIQNLIYKNSIDAAGLYVSKLSLFMRKILNYSDHTFITLNEEIEMIKLELDLEKLRFNTNVGFSVSASNDIVFQIV